MVGQYRYPARCQPARPRGSRGATRAAAGGVSKLPDMDTTGNTLAFFGILVLSLSTAFLPIPDRPTVTKKGLLRALEAEAANAAGGEAVRFAVGYNGNLDLVVSATAALTAAAVEPATGEEAGDRDVITSTGDLSAAFSHWFGESAAAERTIKDAELFDRLVEAARGVDGAQSAPGGNALLMARELARHEAPVLLGAKVGTTLKQLVGDGVQLASSVSDDDEVHLILEYSEGDVWGDATASRANRFIVSNDEFNGHLRALDDLHAALPQFKPDVLVVAGVHLLEALGTDAYEKRLAELVDSVRATKEAHPGLAVHLEIASMADEAFIKHMSDTLLPVVDSIGLNEQEMGDLYAALGGELAEGDTAGLAKDGAVPLLSEINGRVPAPRAVAAAVRYVLERYPNVGRVHFHSLAFHVLAERRTGKAHVWRKGGAAAAAAATTATLRACDAAEPDLHGNDLDLILPALAFSVADPAVTPSADAAEPRVTISEAEPVARWSWASSSGDVAFKLAPVLVCKEPKATVGLGDAISASGLAVHTAQSG